MPRKKLEEIHQNQNDDEADKCDKADKDDIEDGSETELYGKELIQNLLKNLFKDLGESNNCKTHVSKEHKKKVPKKNFSQSSELKKSIHEKRKKISEDVFRDVKRKIQIEPGKYDNFEMGIITPKFKSLETQILYRFQEFVENTNLEDETFLYHFNASSTTSEVNKHILR